MVGSSRTLCPAGHRTLVTTDCPPTPDRVTYSCRYRMAHGALLGVGLFRRFRAWVILGACGTRAGPVRQAREQWPLSAQGASNHCLLNSELGNLGSGGQCDPSEVSEACGVMCREQPGHPHTRPSDL